MLNKSNNDILYVFINIVVYVVLFFEVMCMHILFSIYSVSLSLLISLISQILVNLLQHFDIIVGFRV